MQQIKRMFIILDDHESEQSLDELNLNYNKNQIFAIGTAGLSDLTRSNINIYE